VDPIGSATSFDALLLVEWPLPWPQDVSEIPALAAAAGHGGARVMTVVPHTLDASLRVVHRRRVATHRLAGVDHVVAAAAIPDLLARILEDPMADSSALASFAGPAPAEVLVCGHGRRDTCCGRWGTQVHAELAARGGPARVWRCSHTGGHRFAPTAITLPDGRAWADVDADLLEAVVARTARVAELGPHDRGNSAFDRWAQVVDRALFERLGWAWLDTELTAQTTDVAAGKRFARVTMSWRDESGEHHADATVEVLREYPVLVCGQPPEAATKTSQELGLASLSLRRA